jgi:hypothetical protein
MKIDSKFIENIFTLKIKLKRKEDKIKLSKYEDMIPMYDIFSHKIYPINKLNIHTRLIDYHYRFINEEIKSWLENLYNKIPDNEMEVKNKFKYNLDVIDNYDIETLIETSYKTLYKYSPDLGLQISICKRNSFHPYIHHLKPYYTKNELIKLGKNMNIINRNEDINPEYLLQKDVHYEVCKIVSKNDVSFNEIKSHHEHIVSLNCISWVCFYSFVGSFLFNKCLRQNKYNELNKNYMNGMNKLVECIKTAPALDNDYDIYRFIWDDSFIVNLKEGDYFIDNGFISTTRDPFYSPGLNGNFGLILLKIKIPKGKKGVGLFIENFSLFAKEEEFLLAPKSKLKLISKNNNFTYYHTNMEFEKLINRKYEFELVDSDNTILDLHDKVINNIDIKTITIDGIDRINIIKDFIRKYSNNNMVHLMLNNKIYNFDYMWFDSSTSSSYEKFYYNKMQDGLLLSIYDTQGYPYLNIELGKEMVVNFLNKYYFKSTNNIKLDNDILDLVLELGSIFHYKEAIIFHEYNNYIKFNDTVFSYMNQYNNSMYMYLKTGVKFLDSSFTNYNIGYWYVDEYFSKNINENIRNRLPDSMKELNTMKELFIKIVETDFNLYNIIIDLMDSNIFKKSYIVYNIYDRLLAENRANNFKPSIEYNNNNELDDNFKLIFRQPIRRL